MSDARPGEDEHSVPRRGVPWLAYLQLFRLPNVFTAVADVAMGFLVTTRSWQSWPSLTLSVIASALVYTAGMVLNDVWDVEVDRRERPGRPIPSGRIPWTWARWLGVQFLLVGMACGWLAGFSSPELAGPAWRSGLVVTALATAVILYDARAKYTWLGPAVMGSCRGLNVLLGMSLNAQPVPQEWQFLQFGSSHLLIAGGIGLYIVGVTVYARSEAAHSPRGPLVLGVGLMLAGIALLAFFPRWHLASFDYRYEPLTTWPLAMLMISVWIVRRALLAIRDPRPRYVQAAVKHCILSLIVLDAMVCSLVCDWSHGVAIVLLVVPSLILGRWVYST